MTSCTPCALLIDPPHNGPWNMAVDESLLDSFSAGPDCCWRFYQWQEPTLSLGYFQTWEDRRRHPASQQCPIVRRASGGGAIVHDVELTYSFVAPADTPWARQPRQLYELVHATLIDALAELGASQAMLSGQPGGDASEQKPFLCFQRLSPGDVLYGGAKIAGSAQRRRHGAVLQHGSVLLQRSAAAPELPGIAELTNCNPTCYTLMDAWLPRLEKDLGLFFSRRELTRVQQQQAENYVEAKYASDSWTIKRESKIR